MKYMAWIALAGVAFALMLDTAQAQVQSLEQKADRYLGPLVDTNNFYGVVLIEQAGKSLLSKGYGFSSLEHQVRNTENTKFQIASLSKPFTAAAVVLLAQRGRIDLNAPLSETLPDYPNGDRLTIHQLLVHSSGIPDINVQPVYVDLSLKARTPAALVDAFKNLPLQFNPGAQTRYSNSNYNLLALIIERVSGLAYGEFMRQEIFRPLEMENSNHRGDAQAIIPNLAEGYAPIGRTDLQRAPWLDWTVKTGNGSLYTTTTDLRKWVRGFFGGKVLSPASVKLALTPHVPDVGFGTMGAALTGVGYGWAMMQHLGREKVFFFGRSPGFSSHLSYYPKEDLTIIVLSNTYSLVTTPTADAMAAMVFGEPYDEPKVSATQLPGATIDRLVGTYQFDEKFSVPNMKLDVSAAGGHLSITTNFAGFPPSALIFRSDLRFIVRSYWLGLDFLAELNGNATALTFAGAKATRVK
jgi:CubicO group peptidase (beta-lactamase class C family)